MTPHDAKDRPLFFARMDVERRLGFPAGRFTQPGPVLPLILAGVITVAFYGALVPLGDAWINRSFTERGYVPYFIVFFAAWAFAILFIKTRKVALQRKALIVGVAPDDSDFFITPTTAADLIERLHALADDPAHFMLLNRVHVGVSNLHHRGQIADVDQVLRSQAEADEDVVESSYTVVRGLTWAIPVLGFIGTVLGLSAAIGSFGAVLSSESGMTELKPALQSVTAGLATAFETTLQALVAALVLQMFMTMIKRSEEQMLDEFREYCQRRIVQRLRIETQELPSPRQALHAAARPSSPESESHSESST